MPELKYCAIGAWRAAIASFNHDSFIAQCRSASSLELYMEGAYLWKVRVQPIITLSPHSRNSIRLNYEEAGYEAYHRRHADFFGEEQWERMRGAILAAENASGQRQAAE
jgi:hypothetical protein